MELNGNELTRVTLRTEDDILRLHEICMLLGRWAGLPVPERIRFSAGIATHSNPYNSEPVQVGFSLEEKDNQICLIVEIQNHSRKIQKRILHPNNEVPATSIADILHDNIVDREKHIGTCNSSLLHWHMTLNSLTKLKLALDLVRDEKMSLVINNYFQIINQSAGKLKNIRISLNTIIQVADISRVVVKPV